VTPPPTTPSVANGVPAASTTTDPAPPLPLRAVPGAARYAIVGEELVLDASASTGASQYQWFFGNGASTEAGPDATARVVFDRPGRYQVVLRAFDSRGNQQSAGVTVSVTYPPVEFGSNSNTLARVPGSGDVVVVSTDANQLIVLSPSGDNTWSVARRIPTCQSPRTVTVWQNAFATACQRADRIGVYPIAGGTGTEVVLPYGAGPFGVAADGERLFVSEQSSGRLTRIGLDDTGAPVVAGSVDVGADARGVAALPDGRVAVTRWRTRGDRSEIALVDPNAGSVDLVALAFDNQVASDAGISGIPSYLAQVVVSPTGREAFIPSLMANFTQGAFLSGRALTFETTIRASLSRVDLMAGVEDFPRRFQFDERGLAGAIAFSKRGDFGYVVMPANRSVLILDLLTGVEAGVLVDSGFAPDGAVVVGDDDFLLVNSQLSRELVVYQLKTPGALPVSRVSLLETEPLTAEVLRGKQLFNDAADPRIAQSGYIACANCHLEGDSDRNVWDFTNRGEGLRNTISMLGRAGTGDGPVHWTANFDEIQDFEHDIRNAFGGSGLIPDEIFNAGSRNTTLGDTKAGTSADLDALAAYVTSLVTVPKSPFRNPDGSLSAAALRGKATFESAELGCTTCHSGPRLTDSRLLAPAQPLLHDVGTARPSSGQRLGQTLPGFDTPTLHALWASPPYLHDGSAATLQAVLTERNQSDQHGTTSQLLPNEVDDLALYLLSLDGSVD
jgi:cytochrome c peroxidase